MSEEPQDREICGRSNQGDGQEPLNGRAHLTKSALVALPHKRWRDQHAECEQSVDRRVREIHKRSQRTGIT